MMLSQCLVLVFSVRMQISQLYEKHNKEEVDKLIQNVLNYGHATWYGWQSEHWGTKWNMYCREQENNRLTFNTAWAAPIRVYEALAKTLPEDVILKLSTLVI